MKCLTLILTMMTFLSLMSQELPYGYPESQRVKLSLNQDWKFHLGDAESKLFTSDTDVSDWKQVHLPHTLELTSLTLDGLMDEKTQLVFHRKVGWYRKSIQVTSDPSKKVFLEFEGAHQVTDLWVNGRHVGQHSVGGYTPFHFDISDFVNRGQNNQICLKVDNRRRADIPPDPGPFDYVKFSGLYRDVYLVETDPVHITFNWEDIIAGVTITAPTVDPINKNATINVKTVVRNEALTNKKTKVITRVIDRDGLVVLKMIQDADIASGQDFQFNQIGSIEDDLHLWDTDDPYLYRVNTEVMSDNVTVDCIENKWGFRKFELDPEQGFMLNNRRLKVIGFNRHQQYPYVGDAVPNSLHYKDMLQFKELGFNMMRTAHYPQDDAIMDACDELGILVYEEAPTWISISTDDTWWDNLEKATRSMIRNHRNHPSIVIWGGGVNHRGYVPRVHNVSKQEDPWRLTASQGSRWTGWQTSGLTDINANMLYGPFIWDRSEPMFAMEGRSGAAEIAKFKRDIMMAGLLSWTAHAYYTFHPTHARAEDKRDRTRSGAMTIFRYPKKGILWYPSELRSEPYLHVEEDWKPDTKELTIYSNGDEIELSLNGKLIDRIKPSTDTIYNGLDHPPFHYPITDYADGTLLATAYQGGVQIAQQILRTPLEPESIRIELDTMGRSFVADGSDILLAYAFVVDKNGTVLREAEHLIQFSIDGDATIIGDGADINANPMFTEFGMAPVLIKAGTTSDVLTLSATANDLKSSTVTFTSERYNNDVIKMDAEPIYDFEKIRVDLGAPNQLVQFDWTPWLGSNNDDASTTFDAFDAFNADISSTSEDGVIRWLGEMNVIGKYGYVYGDGIISIDRSGMRLTLEGLPAGNYRLRTYHHAPRSNTDPMDPNKDQLKTLKILDIPYENDLQISVTGQDVSSQVKVTSGKNMQFDKVAIADHIFHSDGINPVEVIIKGKGEKGVWLNGFELSQWH